MIDRKTLQQLRNSDAEAFEKIYNNYYTFVFLAALKYMRNEEDAKDMRSTCFIKLWEMREKIVFENDATVAGWLRNTVRNSCVDKLRHLNIREGKKDSIRRNSILMLETDDAFEATDKEAVIIERLRKGIEKLPFKFKQVFKMRWLDDLRFTEIAVILNQKVSTVKKRYARALLLLKQNLDGYGYKRPNA